MPSPPTPASPARAPRRGGGRTFAGELQFLLIALAMVAMLLIAGVPGEVRRAGEGSEALRLGWAAQHAASVAGGLAEGGDDARDAQAAPDGELPQDAGLDPSAPQR
jgi:hypothetical protein